MPATPIITTGKAGALQQLMAANAPAFAVREWRGSGPPALHVHLMDPEAWEVLEGTLRFRFADRSIDVPAGTSVFVPAGVPHTYEAIEARYKIFLTPRLEALIAALQATRDRSRDREIYRTFESELVEG